MNNATIRFSERDAVSISIDPTRVPHVGETIGVLTTKDSEGHELSLLLVLVARHNDDEPLG